VRDAARRAVIDKLIARGVDPEEPVVATVDGPLTGKTLVVTGTLSASRAARSRSGSRPRAARSPAR
jgi:NAD-dependent DNA ligase